MFSVPSLVRDSVAVLCVLTACDAVRAGVAALGRRRGLRPEMSRKLLHLGMGTVALTYPFLFGSAWPVVLINAGFVVVLLLGRVCEAMSGRWREVICRVERETVGEIYFPVSVAALFVLAGGDPLLFCVPVLILTVADAAAAVIGCEYGRHTYRTAAGRKSVEGSAAFFVCAFLVTQLPLSLWTTVTPPAAIGIACVVAAGMTIVEAVSWRGMDNLLLPLGSFALLSVLLRAAAAAA